MKYFFPITTLFFFATYSNAQMILAVGQSPVLYVGADNYLQLGLNKYNVNKVKLTASDGILTNNGDGSYRWKVCNDTVRWVRFRCFVQGDMTKAVDSILFRVKSAPNPIVLVSPSATDFKDLNRRPMGVRASMETDFTADMPFKIQEYTVIIVKKNGDTVSYRNKGSQFTIEVFQAIYSLKKGDKYKVTKATAINDCEMKLRNLEDTEFYIIN